MNDLDRMQAEAQATVERLQGVLAEAELNSIPAPPNPFGSGLGVAWTTGDFCVLSVCSGDPSAVNLATGVLRDVDHDRAAILDVTNRLTRDRALFPCVLHDAEAGWDVMILQRFPTQWLLAMPRLLQQCLESLPSVADQAAVELSRFGGRRPQWSADFPELITRSML